MKGDPAVIEKLNGLLRDELTAINQYFVHSEMCENWGYEKLKKLAKDRAITEMKHAEKLIERIIFLDGRPIVSKLEKITIGEAVPEQLENDLGLEYGAVKQYNDGIKLCVAKGDNGTKELLDGILKDEEQHVDDLEAQKDQVAQMGLQIYLSAQTTGAA